MNEQEFQDALRELLEQAAEADLSEVNVPRALKKITRVRTLAELGVLTSNAGLVVRTLNGSEFQITVVRNR